MSDRLPNICYYNNQEYNFQKPYSETTAKVMDDEVLKMIAEQYDRAKEILKEHKEGHNQLAQLLIDKEVIFAEDVEKIFGKRPWISRSEELMSQNEPKAVEGTIVFDSKDDVENKEQTDNEEGKDEKSDN